MALANLDAVLLESRGTLESLPEHVLAQLEDVQRMQTPRASASPQAEGEQLNVQFCSLSTSPLVLAIGPVARSICDVRFNFSACCICLDILCSAHKKAHGFTIVQYLSAASFHWGVLSILWTLGLEHVLEQAHQQ